MAAPGNDDEPLTAARRILHEVWNLFVQKGRWPTTFEVDRVLYSTTGVALPELVKRMPPGLVHPEFERWGHVWQPDRITKLSPTVAGLCKVSEAAPYVEPFVAALKYLVARAASLDSSDPQQFLTISRKEIAEALGVAEGAVALRVIERLLQTDAPGMAHSMGSTDDDHWSITLNELGARHYDKVATADDFIALRAQDRSEYESQMRMMRARPELADPAAHPIARALNRRWVKVVGGMAGAVVVGVVTTYLTGTFHIGSSSVASPKQPTKSETAGGAAQTWTNYTDGGGTQGPTIGSGATIQVSCKIRGLAVQNGNTWWYRIASPGWDNMYYASADAFYNNGATSGPLKNSSQIDTAVPGC